ncbi:MAG: DUF2145 domain-containing protein [Paucibacter sp.]|nr:DUF2145 domain-containing protein [Roseateles sp.]
MRRWIAALLLVLPLSALAGQTCSHEPPTVAEIERGMALAQATAIRLDASGARVVLLARAGQDLSEYGLRWSHFGFVYKTREGSWRVLHKLNECGSANSALYRQGLGEFFMDKPWRYEAAFVVPKPELQEALLPLLSAQRGANLGAKLDGNDRVDLLNEPRYSMVAYAWGTRYQQSNQWALETLAMAASPEVRSRQTAQDWLRAHGYRPGVLHLSALKRLGAETTRANVSFSDHPSGERFAGRIATVTADSVFSWMPRAGLSSSVELVP